MGEKRVSGKWRVFREIREIRECRETKKSGEEIPPDTY